MRLLRLLAVLVGDTLDRLRRRLLSWAGVAASAASGDATGVDDRPAPWLEYIRARAPWLVAGRRHLPSRSVSRVEPTWPHRSGAAVPNTIPPTSVTIPTASATAAPAFTTPSRAQQPTAGSSARKAAPPKQPKPDRAAVVRAVPDTTRPEPPASPDSRAPEKRVTQSIRGIPSAGHSSPPMSTPSAPQTAPRRTSSRPALAASTPLQVPRAEAAENPAHAPPERPRADGVRRAQPNTAEQQWPPLAHEAEAPAVRRTPEHAQESRPVTAAPEPSPLGMAWSEAAHATGSSDDDGFWADLPDRGFGEWQVQSSRSLIREQLHLARLLAEQAGSSWSALHS